MLTIILAVVVIIGIPLVAYASHRVRSEPDRYPQRIREGALTPTATPVLPPPATYGIPLESHVVEVIDMAIVRGVRASYGNLPYRRFDR